MADGVGGVSVVLPCYDEEHRLGGTLERLVSSLDAVLNGPWEVIVADDGSTDATRNVATAAGDPRVRLVSLPVHTGKGAATRAGFAAATLDLVAIVDADLPVPVETIAELAGRLATADLVLGSRRLRRTPASRAQPFARRLGGRAFLGAIALLGLRSTSDPQCGVKALRREAAAPVLAAVVADGFGFDVELIARARAAGLRVVELPVEWTHVAGSSIRPVRDAARTLVELVDVRRRLRRAG